MNQHHASSEHPPVLGQCPVCENELTVTRLDCENCGTSISGAFQLSRFSRLSADHLRFLEVFIKNRGVIKDVEAELGISYPTVRARLDEVIRQLGYAPDDDGQPRPSQSRDARREILEQLQNKQITSGEASRRLAALTQNGD